LGRAAGKSIVPCPSFPEEATTTIPAATAPSMARVTVWLWPPPPRLRLMTRIFVSPWLKFVAKSMPAATSKNEPKPSRSSTFTGIRLTPKASPATPRPLFVASAIVAATCVPWPSSSLACGSSPTKSKPGRNGVSPQSGAFTYRRPFAGST
jgi:hypothetical protein